MTTPTPILARYPGRCPECRGAIRAGEDLICRVEYADEIRAVHEECVPYWSETETNQEEA